MHSVYRHIDEDIERTAILEAMPRKIQEHESDLNCILVVLLDASFLNKGKRIKGHWQTSRGVNCTGRRGKSLGTQLGITLRRGCGTKSASERRRDTFAMANHIRLDR